VVRGSGGDVAGVARVAAGFVAGRSDGTSGAGGIDEWRIVALGACGASDGSRLRGGGAVGCR
jgi:hypothetical protein